MSIPEEPKVSIGHSDREMVVDTQMVIMEVAGDSSMMVITSFISSLGYDAIHVTTMMAILLTKVTIFLKGDD